jgi:hypothetical protein
MTAPCRGSACQVWVSDALQTLASHFQSIVAKSPLYPAPGPGGTGPLGGSVPSRSCCSSPLGYGAKGASKRKLPFCIRPDHTYVECPAFGIHRSEANRLVSVRSSRSSQDRAERPESTDLSRTRKCLEMTYCAQKESFLTPNHTARFRGSKLCATILVATFVPRSFSAHLLGEPSAPVTKVTAGGARTAIRF